MSEKLTDAVDLSHHLSEIAKARTTSPLKGLQKYLGNPHLISLAGGTPDPNYFPFDSITGQALAVDVFPLTSSPESSTLRWFWNLFGSSKENTIPVTVDKFPAKKGDINLATALQYGTATGLPQLQETIKELVGKIFQPAYSNWTIMVSTGNTDAWNKTVMTICNPGDAILTSDWTYPSALASALPFDIHPVPIVMDGQGMRSDDLRKVLSEWDDEARGIRRPRVLYTVPVGQNPTGATMLAARKKEIYAVCVEFDVIIVEDDPYYFLQFGTYVPKDSRVELNEEDNDAFISSLAPSYLKFDYQGRVIRLDTFSKTVAPGCRLGWFTCNPLFAERFERQGETSTQAPCGFGQAMVASLLQTWHYDGYVRWLRGLRVQYRHRRDFFIDTLVDEFDLRIVTSAERFRSGSHVYNAYPKPKRSITGCSEKASVNDKPLFSFIPPSSGMFVWLKLHFENHPSFSTVGFKVLEKKLWIDLANAGVLFGPGHIFHATAVTDETPGDGHFRISFSMLSHEDMKKAVTIFASVLRKFMNEAV